MSDGVKVSVVSAGPGRALLLKWLDPETHERRFQSSNPSNASKMGTGVGRIGRCFPDLGYGDGEVQPDEHRRRLRVLGLRSARPTACGDVVRQADHELPGVSAGRPAGEVCRSSGGSIRPGRVRPGTEARTRKTDGDMSVMRPTGH